MQASAATQLTAQLHGSIAKFIKPGRALGYGERFARALC